MVLMVLVLILCSCWWFCRPLFAAASLAVEILPVPQTELEISQYTAHSPRLSLSRGTLKKRFLSGTKVLRRHAIS